MLPSEFVSEWHYGSEHDLDPNDIHFSDSGDITLYMDGALGPNEPPIGPQVVVNPAESPPTGWGAPNHQQFQTGHTQNVPTNESAEQGKGVGPERKWPHYPHAENPNPYRSLNAWQRAGTDDYSNDIYRVEAAAFWYQGIIDSLQHAPDKQRTMPNPVMNQAPSVPFVQVVPPLVDY